MVLGGRPLGRVGRCQETFLLNNRVMYAFHPFVDRKNCNPARWMDGELTRICDTCIIFSQNGESHKNGRGEAAIVIRKGK